MADESYGFTQARARLEEIVSAVRKKDTSLEKSLDLLEEGVRLANQCTELIDHADWEAAGTGQPIVADADAAVAEAEASDDPLADVAAADGESGSDAGADTESGSAESAEGDPIDADADGPAAASA